MSCPRSTIFLSLPPCVKSRSRETPEAPMADDLKIGIVGCAGRMGQMLVRQVAAAEGCVVARSEEHTSELQSLMRITYAVFCLKKKSIINMQAGQWKAT